MAYRNIRQDFRKKTYKKALDADEARKKREEHQVEIRKSKKEESIMKKRREQLGSMQGMMGNGEMGSTSVDQSGMRMGVASSSADAISMLSGASANTSAALASGLERLPEMAKGIMSNDQDAQYRCTMEIRKLLSLEQNPPIDEVIAQGVVQRFVEFLSWDNVPELQFEAAWALTNIASGTSKHTLTVIENGAIPIFIRLLRAQNEEVREQAVWALGNIAGDSHSCRDLVINNGALEAVLSLLNPQAKISLLRNATWTLSNLCRGKPQPNFEIVRNALPTLAHLIYMQDEEVLADACWALSYLSDGTNDKIQAVIEAGVVPKLVELLNRPSTAIQTPVLRTIGNIVTGDDLQTQAVIDAGVLLPLAERLNSVKKSIRKEACWTISNITAGNRQQIQAVIDAGIIPQLIHLLATAEFDIRKEAAWAVSNATSGGTSTQVVYLVRQNAIPPLCNQLDVQEARIIQVALEGLENILRVGETEREAVNGTENEFALIVDQCGGLDKIERLQTHSNHDIYEKSVKILENYFQADQEQVDGLAPAVEGDHFNFGVAGHNAFDGGNINFDGQSMS
eukprot:CAMPEP_0184706388 /NCGR_PEP_ID=MMETSP0313-20130426/36732_1 /TAXON_ID=2792 /ORGANISM="Porphyridium aerugineum, Strain SAG 1380-2" /LENGTH=567 /DNA_ID=CAMNT_0027167941 /DNA_START=773 /DNA_END=2476 /DNA_ORIENTATION=-